MKVVIGGATGLLGSELVRQSLRMPTVTSVVALGRRPVDVPQGADPSKLKNVVVEDFGNFSEEVRKEFEGANACIWYGLQNALARHIPCCYTADGFLPALGPLASHLPRRKIWTRKWSNASARHTPWTAYVPLPTHRQGSPSATSTSAACSPCGTRHKSRPLHLNTL